MRAFDAVQAEVEADPARRVSLGLAARSVLPLDDLATFDATDRADPIALLEEQASTRVADLVPIRYGRMAASPFAFYRGAAAVMASDLARRPTSRLRVQLGGDAHLANFGTYASPERDLVFDMNDFDETLAGPFEWDLARLVASFTIATREAAFGRKARATVARAVVDEYRRSMTTFAGMRTVDVWHARLDAAAVLARWRSNLTKAHVKQFERRCAKAEGHDSLAAFAKLAERVDGRLRIISRPPLIVPLDELVDDVEAEHLAGSIHDLLRRYFRTLAADRRRLFESYRVVDIARKVVGVGSVGTRTWVILMLGRDGNDPLFLQVKEAQPSVLEKHLGRSRYANHAQRVVEGQRLTQAATDVALGWDRTAPLPGVAYDYYVRQLWDWKMSVDVARMSSDTVAVYARVCGLTLARAHARTGDRIALASYLGNDDRADRALNAYGESYADQNERDHAALVDAIRTGRLTAETGV
jgi:uncharacterized protein (DUF2252 family)